MASNDAEKGAHALIVLAAAAILAAAIKLSAAFITPFLLATYITITIQPIFRWIHNSHIPNIGTIIISLLIMIKLLTDMGTLLMITLTNIDNSTTQYTNSLHQIQIQATTWLEAHHQ